MKKNIIILDRMRNDNEPCPNCGHPIHNMKCKNCKYPHENTDVDGDSIKPDNSLI